MATFKILSEQFQHYVDSCNALSSLSRNILKPTSTTPPYAVIQQIANKSSLTEVELEYAQHVVVRIFTNMLGAAANEAIMVNTETRTPVVYTMGIDKPIKTPFSIDNGFEKNIPIAVREVIINEITTELSKLIVCDALNPGGSIMYSRSRGSGHGVEEYLVERVAIARPKVHQTRSAPE